MIGGEHYLIPPAHAQHSLGEMLAKTTGEISFFSTGRDALFSLLANLPHRYIYLPDLVCWSVYQACIAAGKKVITYPVDSGFIGCAQNDPQKYSQSCLLVMHYFGVTNCPLMSNAKSAGLMVISDVTHMLFNPEQLGVIARKSNYLIASLRKSGPFPDGGFVSSLAEPIVQPTLPIREDFFTLRAAGLLSRGFSAQSGFGDNENFRLLRKAEDVINQSSPAGHECSYLARRLLTTVNVTAVALKMSVNMQVLAAELDGVCGTPCRAGFVSPYYCCVFRHRVERDFVRDKLADHQYFCPIHWDTSQLPKPSPHSECILSIPCDGRYEKCDMLNIVSVIKSCIKK